MYAPFIASVAAAAILSPTTQAIQTEYQFVDLAGTASNSLNQVADVGTDGTVLGTAEMNGAFVPVLRDLQGNLTVLAGINGDAFVHSMNSSGQVVGSFVAGLNNNSTEGFFWENGVTTPLGVLAGLPVSTTIDINESGLVLGAAGFSGGGPNRVLIPRPTLSMESDPLAQVMANLAPRAVNGSGQIAGSANSRAVLYDGTQLISFDLPTSTVAFTSASANDVNDAGLVVGGALRSTGFTSDNRRAFIWQAGAPVIEIPGVDGRAVAINNAGVVVGETNFEPFRYTVGGPVELLRDLIDLPAGFRLRSATRINDAGFIIGEYFDGPNSFDPLPFLLVPTTDLGETFCATNPNSTGATGEISALGSVSLADDNLILRASSLPDAFGLFLSGTQRNQSVLGDGFLCVGGAIRRLNAPIFATGGEAMLDVDLSGFGSGDTAQFQFWHRDSTMGGGSGVNLTNGIEMTFVN